MTNTLGDAFGPGAREPSPPVSALRASPPIARTLVTHKDILGQMARFSVIQHPCGWPEGLKDVLTKIKGATDGWPDGIDSLRMKWFDGWLDIERWLRNVVEGDATVIAWNTPRSGHTAPFLFTSRYDTPKAEHDFIDIDALLRNVALAVWRENAQGIEAGTAETRSGSVEDESPTPQGDAPKAGSP